MKPQRDSTQPAKDRTGRKEKQTDKADSTRLGSWAQYENEKSAWDAANPGASCSVRDAAMHSIANRLGV